MTSEEYKALSVKEFTEAAKIYDSGHSGVYEMCKDDYPFLLEELEKEPFDTVLDCGCGTGPAIELLHEKYPEKHFTGLDLTPEMIHVAQEKNCPTLLLSSEIVKIFLSRKILLTRSSLPTASTTIRIHRTFSTVLTGF